MSMISYVKAPFLSCVFVLCDHWVLFLTEVSRFFINSSRCTYYFPQSLVFLQCLCAEQFKFWNHIYSSFLSSGFCVPREDSFFSMVEVVLSPSHVRLLRPRGLQPARLLCPWDFPGKNIGVGCHFLLQGIFLTQGANLCLLNCRQILHQLSHQASSLFSHGFF